MRGKDGGGWAGLADVRPHIETRFRRSRIAGRRAALRGSDAHYRKWHGSVHPESGGPHLGSRRSGRTAARASVTGHPGALDHLVAAPDRAGRFLVSPCLDRFSYQVSSYRRVWAEVSPSPTAASFSPRLASSVFPFPGPALAPTGLERSRELARQRMPRHGEIS